MMVFFGNFDIRARDWTHEAFVLGTTSPSAVRGTWPASVRTRYRTFTTKDAQRIARRR